MRCQNTSQRPKISFYDSLMIVRILENGFSFPGYPSVALAPFESNLAYTLRFMIDTKVLFQHVY